MARSHHGFSLLELVVVIIVAGLVGTAFLERLHFYQELAEKAAVESTLRLIKTGLQMRLAELIVANRQGEARKLAEQDPTEWYRPANYGGAYRSPVEPGNWYFDTQRAQLVYVVNLGERLTIENAGGPRELRFQARLITDRLNVNGTVVDSVTGVVVLPVTQFRWSHAKPEPILA